ncbi:lipid II:glycine glycyltransferase FemX [Thermogemmatispora sp.]|uniref:lipid II:glycine glycyltransferase FemX n=1 Tax=Thermogemmatispora sp. TaxID=1968838 RepID=UPI002ACC213F|nr:peptidoglycan bridge formation glycyltransferase FemA/FemB family protein [Thermogemmatispora sp.]
MRQGYVLRVISERRIWDDFLEQHDGHLLQSWGWGELKAEAGWRPLRLALCECSSGRIVAAAQVLCRGAARLPHWCGHLAYIPRGPVLDWSHEECCKAFWMALHRWLRPRGALALRLEPPLLADTAEGEAAARFLLASGFRPVRTIQPLRTIMVDLRADETTLLSRMKEKWRYNLRLAARRGVKVREAQTLEDVRAWYELLKITAARDGFGIHRYEYYEHAWLILAPRNQLDLLLAEYEGRLLAGIFVGRMGREALYLYGASSNELRQLMPNYLLQWEAMCRARAAGAIRYDLWGIPETEDEHEPLAGVYRFKRGWGGEVVRFIGGYEYIYRPLSMTLARRLLSERLAL